MMVTKLSAIIKLALGSLSLTQNFVQTERQSLKFSRFSIEITRLSLFCDDGLQMAGEEIWGKVTAASRSP